MAILSILIDTCALPIAMITLPQLGSSPAIAVFTNGELAIEKAINKTEPLPDELNYILNEKEHYEILDNNVDKIKNYVKEKIS